MEDLRDSLQRYMGFSTVIGILIVAMCLMVSTLFWVWTIRSPEINRGPATAVLNIIAAPSATQPAPIASPTIFVEVTSTAPAPPLGAITVGAYVQIAGTGGDGLRLRTTPDLDGEVRFLGLEAEVFQVADGPQNADGFAWWYLVEIYDDTIQGWAVSNFLVVIQNP